MPSAGAFPARGQVSARAIMAGEAESHGHDGDPFLIVELLPGQAEPAAQAVAGRVAEGDARGVHAHAGRLAADADAGRGALAQDRVRRMRQRGAFGSVDADAAGADLAPETAELA